MQFSFEYCIVPKGHKYEEEIKANAVEGAMQPKALTGSYERRRSTIQTLKHCSSVGG